MKRNIIFITADQMRHDCLGFQGKISTRTPNIALEELHRVVSRRDCTGDASEPFFMWLSYSRPHSPCRPPTPYSAWYRPELLAPQGPMESQRNFSESVRLPNGDYIKPFAPRPIPESKLSFPLKPIREGAAAYGQQFQLYLPADLPLVHEKAWELLRLKKGATEWIKEKAKVHIPGLLFNRREGVVIVPRFDVLKLAPDGSVWCLEYRQHRSIDGKDAPASILILRSNDSGENWDIWSDIPYQPDLKADPDAEKRVGGYGEPDVDFLPDGTALMLLRTTDGNGPGPLYAVRSDDMGKTWSNPWFFDNLGVWPQLLTLENGVTLATYGRPGFFLRATSDLSALRWQEKITIVHPQTIYYDTCSYSAMLPLDKNSALLAYSNFRYFAGDGKQRKAIMVRKVTTTPQPSGNAN